MRRVSYALISKTQLTQSVFTRPAVNVSRSSSAPSRSLLGAHQYHQRRWCASVAPSQGGTSNANKPDTSKKEESSGDGIVWNILGAGGIDVDPIDAGKMMMLGFVILGSAIVGINVNERRAVKQDILNDFTEKRVVSVNEGDADCERAFVNSVVHAHGPIKVTGTLAHDPVLGVEVEEGVLRLKRTVEMYQWVEKVESTDKETKEKTYSYSKEWGTYRHKTHDAIKTNPAFPTLGAVEEPSALVLLASTLSGATMKLLFGKDFLNRLDDWSEVPVRVTDSSAAVMKNLQFNKDEMGFYTTGGDPSNPQIGDVRVQYECVKPGVFTVLGKYSTKRNFLGYQKRLGNKELQPFTASLRKPLRKEAAIDIPDEAHTLARTFSTENLFVIPDWVASLGEGIVLGRLPLEFAMVKRGAESKQVALDSHRDNCFYNTEAMYASCLGSCVLGVWLIAIPLGIVNGVAQLALASTAGFSIATKCRYNAKWQLENVFMQGEPETTKRGADVTL